MRGLSSQSTGTIVASGVAGPEPCTSVCRSMLRLRASCSWKPATRRFEVDFACQTTAAINDEGNLPGRHGHGAGWVPGQPGIAAAGHLTSHDPAGYETSIHMLGWGVPTSMRCTASSPLTPVVSGTGGDGNYNVGRYSNQRNGLWSIASGRDRSAGAQSYH